VLRERDLVVEDMQDVSPLAQTLRGYVSPSSLKTVGCPQVYGGHTYTVLDVKMHQQEYFLWPMTERSFEEVASLVSGGVTPRPEADLPHLVVQPTRSARAYSMRNLVASDATSPVRATPRSRAKSGSRSQFPTLAFQSNTTRAPEALDSLGPEERRTVYSMLGLRIQALPDKSLRVQDAFGEESLVCHHDRTSTR
jgi:hypothetical protein